MPSLVRYKVPNFAHILRTNPRLLRITHKGVTWSYKICGNCWKEFWKDTRNRGLNANPIHSVYCSTRCQREARAINNRERQERYRRRLKRRVQLKKKTRRAVRTRR